MGVNLREIRNFSSCIKLPLVASAILIFNSVLVFKKKKLIQTFICPFLLLKNKICTPFGARSGIRKFLMEGLCLALILRVLKGLQNILSKR